jgi:hypothetical protein
LKTRETVATDTPLSFATSWMVEISASFVEFPKTFPADCTPQAAKKSRGFRNGFGGARIAVSSAAVDLPVRYTPRRMDELLALALSRGDESREPRYERRSGSDRRSGDDRRRVQTAVARERRSQADRRIGERRLRAMVLPSPPNASERWRPFSR